MISILCPSRGRPDKARKMAQSILDTADGQFDIKLYLDASDPQYASYKANFMDWPPSIGYNVSEIDGKDQPTNKSWNEMAKDAYGDLLMVCGDDVEFKTKGWDTKLKEAAAQFPDGYAILSVNDGRGGADSHPHPIYTRKMYEALGYVMHPAWMHWYGDSWAAELGKRLGRHIWVGDVLVEHQKPSDQGIFDDTHKRIRNGWMQEREKFVWDHPAMKRAFEAEVGYVMGLIARENS